MLLSVFHVVQDANAAKDLLNEVHEVQLNMPAPSPWYKKVITVFVTNSVGVLQTKTHSVSLDSY